MRSDQQDDQVLVPLFSLNPPEAMGTLRLWAGSRANAALRSRRRFLPFAKHLSQVLETQAKCMASWKLFSTSDPIRSRVDRDSNSRVNRMHDAVIAAQDAAHRVGWYTIARAALPFCTQSRRRVRTRNSFFRSFAGQRSVRLEARIDRVFRHQQHTIRRGIEPSRGIE